MKYLRIALVFCLAGCDLIVGRWFVPDPDMRPPEDMMSPVFPKGVCSDHQYSFCTETNLPHGLSHFGVFVVSSNDVWVVGGLNSMVHWNGTEWSGQFGGEGSLKGVWADEGTAWGVGKSIVKKTPTKPFFEVDNMEHGGEAIWGRSSNDIWVVGYGDFLHYDGKSWQSKTPGLPDMGTTKVGVWTGIHGTSDSLWAVGTTPRDEMGYKIPVAFEIDKQQLESIADGKELSNYIDPRIWTDGSKVWVATGKKMYLGPQWNPIGNSCGATLFALWGVPGVPGSYFGCDIKYIARHDGSTTEIDRQHDHGVIRAIGGKEQIWVVGDGGSVYSFDPITWPPQWQDRVRQRYGEITAIWHHESSVWALSKNGILRRDREGDRWRAGPHDPPSRVQGAGLSAIFAPDGGDVFAIKDKNRIVCFSESGEKPEANGAFNALWGTKDEMWAVGQGGTIMRRLGTTCGRGDMGTPWMNHTAPNKPTGDILSISGTGPSDIWIVEDGTPSKIWHYDGNGWQSFFEEGIDLPTKKIWAIGKGKLWATKEKGSEPDGWVCHGTASGQKVTWDCQPVTQDKPITALFARPSGAQPDSDVWVGWYGGILHYDPSRSKD